MNGWYLLALVVNAVCLGFLTESVKADDVFGGLFWAFCSGVMFWVSFALGRARGRKEKTGSVAAGEWA